MHRNHYGPGGRRVPVARSLALHAALLLVAHVAAPTVFAAPSISEWVIEGEGAIAVRLQIQAAPGSAYEFGYNFSLNGVQGEYGLMHVERFGDIRATDTIVFSNAGDVDIDVTTQPLRLSAGPLPLPTTASGATSHAQAPDEVIFLFDWTGGVTYSRFEVRIQDPGAVLSWETSDVNLLTLEDFRRSNVVSAQAGGLSVHASDEALATLKIEKNLTGFSQLAGGGFGDANLTLETPSGARIDAADVTFLAGAPGKYRFTSTQTTAGLFARQPYVLYADI